MSYFEFPLEPGHFAKEEIMFDKSSRKGKNEGAVDKAKGRVKEATGSLTGAKIERQKDRLTSIRARSRKRRVLQKTF